MNLSAELMNAVNTVQLLSDGSFWDSNTDGEGFVRSLEEAFGNRCKDEKILIIGAGGAAHGISLCITISWIWPNRVHEPNDRKSRPIID